MNKSEQKRFDELYRKHLRALKLQGKSDKTIDAYARAVRRISAWFDCCPGPCGGRTDENDCDSKSVPVGTLFP